MQVNLYGVMPGLGWTSMEVTARYYKEGLRYKNIDVRTCFPFYLSELKFLRRLPFFWKYDDLYWSIEKKILSESRKHAQKNPADIYHVVDHSMAHILPYLPGPKVLTVHDFMGWRFPEMFNVEVPAYKRWEARVRLSVEADILLCVSRATAEDAKKYLDIPEEKIKVVPQALLPCYRQPSTEEREIARKQFGLEKNETLFLFVGADVKRKNIPFLLDVLEEVNKEVPFKGNWRFIKAGGAFSAITQERINNLSIQKAIGEVAFLQKLETAYFAADVFLFPSLYEGFGLPPLEALACGVPVISSNAGSLKEYAGSGKLLDPLDKTAWVESIIETLKNKNKRKENIEAGLRHAKNFTIEKLTEKLIKIYQELL
jgi:glycosyltransferase involved in cell wall biosynthesis